MNLPEYTELLTAYDDGVLAITLNRPDKRNAMNLTLVEEMIDLMETVCDDRSVRAITIRGAGGNFCAGGDISGMNQMGENASEAAWQFNRIFGRMITMADRMPQVVITLLEGAVLGGGFGLACISDVAIADRQARLGMPETGLGVIPAQIAPFVVKRIGLAQARRLALLGDWVDGVEATRLGIAHHVTDGLGEMEARLEKTLASVRRTAPGANAATKALMHQVGDVEMEALLDQAADMFTEALQGPEGQEGTRAFLEKRKPSWAGSGAS